jgi:hypothetical protein
MPATPASFLAAFDSAITVFFSATAPALLPLQVQPAYVYAPPAVLEEPWAVALRFASDANMVQEQATGRYLWKLDEPNLQRTGTSSDLLKNTGGFLYTSITGSDTEKKRWLRYKLSCRIQAQQAATTYLFEIPMLQEETKTRRKERFDDNSKEVILTGGSRGDIMVDTARPGILLAGNDTIARFYLKRISDKLEEDAYNFGWNGIDSASVFTMPAEWNNPGLYHPLELTGTLYGKPFSILPGETANQWIFYIDGTKAGLLNLAGDRPRSGALLQHSLPHNWADAMFAFGCLPSSILR